MLISRLSKNCPMSDDIVKLRGIRFFHSTKNNEMWRRFGIGVGGTIGAGYFAKSKIESINQESTIVLNLHSHKGEPTVNFSIVGDKYKASFSYNPELLHKIDLSKKLEQKPMLPSILESFNFLSFDNFLSIFFVSFCLDH